MPATTPNLSIPYPLAADSVASYPALAKQQAEKIEALVYDSGWVNCFYKAGFTAGTPGQLQARRIGSIVLLRGGATGSLPVNIYTPISTINGAIPAPPVDVYAPAFGTSGKSGGVYISTSREIQVVHAVTAVPTWMSVTCFYTIN